MSPFFRFFLIAAFTVTNAAGARADNTRSLADGATSPPASIRQMAWLTGRWVGEGFGAKLEAVYSPPDHGTMLGHFFVADENGMKFLELVEIKEEKESLVYRVKHFNADFTGWEEKDKFFAFPLVSIDANHDYFDGLTFARVDNRTVAVYLQVKHKDGTIEEAKLLYHRAN